MDYDQFKETIDTDTVAEVACCVWEHILDHQITADLNGACEARSLAVQLARPVEFIYQKLSEEKVIDTESMTFDWDIVPAIFNALYTNGHIENPVTREAIESVRQKFKS